MAPQRYRDEQIHPLILFEVENRQEILLRSTYLVLDEQAFGKEEIVELYRVLLSNETRSWTDDSSRSIRRFCCWKDDVDSHILGQISLHQS